MGWNEVVNTDGWVVVATLDNGEEIRAVHFDVIKQWMKAQGITREIVKVELVNGDRVIPCEF